MPPPDRRDGLLAETYFELGGGLLYVGSVPVAGTRGSVDPHCRFDQEPVKHCNKVTLSNDRPTKAPCESTADNSPLPVYMRPPAD